MEVDWHWIKIKNLLKKEGINYGLFRIWWAICTRKVKS